MGAYIIRRLGHSIFVVLGVVTLVFFILRVLPGDPAAALAGPGATQAEVEQIIQRLGYDRPIHEQYIEFLGQLATGDFGSSLYHPDMPVRDLVLGRMPATLELVVPALILSSILSIIFGVISSLRVGSWLDDVLSTIALFGQAAPNFWIGPLLIIVFARELGWLPTFGRGGISHLVLPVVTLATSMFAVNMRLVRSGMLENLNQEYVRTARARGLKESTVITRHVLRNTLIPVITYMGLQLGNLLSGSVIVETVFAWPGVGRLIVESVVVRDYTVVQASVMLFAAVFVLVNLLVDILYVYLDPRIRYA